LILALFDVFVWGEYFLLIVGYDFYTYGYYDNNLPLACFTRLLDPA